MRDDPPLGEAFERRNDRSRRRKLRAPRISRIGIDQQRKSKIRFRSDVAMVREAREQSGEKVLELTRKNESINTNDPI